MQTRGRRRPWGDQSTRPHPPPRPSRPADLDPADPRAGQLAL